jgi:hypothetical protein
MTTPSYVRKTIAVPSDLYAAIEALGEANFNAYCLRLIQENVKERTNQQRKES